MSETAVLARHIAAISWPNLPPDVQSITREIMVDTLASGLAGSMTDIPAAMSNAVAPQTPGTALVLGGLDRTTPSIATYLNAASINALDHDDTAPTSEHPGSSVMAAALAKAEEVDANGRALLEGIVAGYEVTMRVGAACRWSPERYELVHGMGTFLTMGAAAAAAKVRGFGEEAFRRTFGIAGPMSALPHAGKFGWGEPTLSWLKDNVAWAAEAGHRAAALADAGLPASQTIFDGEKGFWRMAASDVYQPKRITDQKTFYIRQIGFKTYACCRWLHGMLDAVADVQAARAFRPEEISRVRIEAARAIAATFGNKRPATMVDAQFSAPHAVAMQLLAFPKLSWWQAEHRVDPHVLALIDKVELVEDPALTQRFYELGRDSNRIPARVIVELTDGWRGKAYNEEASGAAGRRPPDGSPGPDAETLARKRDELLATRLSSARRERLRDRIARLEDTPHVAELTSLLEPDIADAA